MIKIKGLLKYHQIERGREGEKEKREGE